MEIIAYSITEPVSNRYCLLIKLGNYRRTVIVEDVHALGSLLIKNKDKEITPGKMLEYRDVSSNQKYCENCNKFYDLKGRYCSIECNMTDVFS